jgi:hypothetical protein
MFKLKLHSRVKSISTIIFHKEEFEDTKGVIRIRIPKKNRQHNGQKKKVQKDKQRSTKHTYKTKDRVTGTPLKTRGELRCSGRVSSSCSTSGTRRVILATKPVINRKTTYFQNIILKLYLMVICLQLTEYLALVKSCES